MEQAYRTVERQAEDEFVERRSRFLGAVCPVTTEEQALAFINARRRAFWDATHNVYAYVLREGQVRRYSDDGEPQGTAGMPVLDVLLREGLTDCVVVVTRYFGGVLLGTGGLVRAYARGAKAAVGAGGPVEMRLCSRCVIACEYTQYGRVSALMADVGAILRDTRYTDHVELEFLLPCGSVEASRARLTDISAGSLTIDILGEEYVAVPLLLSADLPAEE